MRDTLAADVGYFLHFIFSPSTSLFSVGRFFPQESHQPQLLRRNSKICFLRVIHHVGNKMVSETGLDWGFW